MSATGIDKLILSGGLAAIGFTVFAESGLLIGILLPGDTLLFGAGILASQDALPLFPLILVIIASAVIGDNVGYSIGRRTGPRIFRKKDGLIFRQEHVERAQNFYERHGGKTIIIARFVPIVRTMAPMIAGVGRMDRKRFMFFNVIGGIFWGAGVTLIGYWLGARLPWLENYIMPIILIITAAVISGSLFHLLKDPVSRQIIIKKLKRGLKSIFLLRSNPKK